MNRSLRKWLLLVIIVALVLAADQLTKDWVVNNLNLYESVQPIPALYPFFQLTRSENQGAAFGFLPQAGDIFLVIALVVVAIMVIFYPRLPEKDRVSRIAIGIVVGGALGNALDRLRHGVVVDFIHYTIPGVVSNVSNLADHAIVIGVLLVVIQSWRADSKRDQTAPPTESEEVGENSPSP
jgi:signal peptidase II